MLQETSPLPARFSHTLSIPGWQRSHGKSLEQAEVDTHGFCNVLLCIKLRITGLASKPGKLCAAAHETTEKHCYIK